jgi:hypothetical protein
MSLPFDMGPGADPKQDVSQPRFHNHIFKPMSDVFITDIKGYRRYGDSKAGGETVVRFLPEPDAANPGRLLPGMNSAGVRTWATPVFMVRYWGPNKRSFFLGVPSMRTSNGLAYVLHDHNPFGIFHDKITKAVNNLSKCPDPAIAKVILDERWGMMFGNSAPYDAMFKKAPALYYIARCLVFRRDDTTFYVPGQSMPQGLRPANSDESRTESLPVLALTDNVWRLLVQRMNQHNIIDPVDLNAGTFARFFKEGDDPRTPRASHSMTSGFNMQPQQAAKKTGFVPWDVAFESFFDGRSDGQSSNISQLADHIVPRLRPFSQILQYYDDKTQAAYMQEDVSNTPFAGNVVTARMIMYAFRDHQDWITPATRERANMDERQPTSLGFGAQPAIGPIAPPIQAPQPAPMPMPAPTPMFNQPKPVTASMPWSGSAVNPTPPPQQKAEVTINGDNDKAAVDAAIRKAREIAASYGQSIPAR